MHFPSCPSRLSCLVACALGVVSIPAHAQTVGGGVGGVVTAGGQPPRDVVRTAGRSIIRGRVIAGDSGTPMRRAVVRLNSPALREPRAASTDADGRYEFTQLAAGRYTIAVVKAAYVNWSYGQTQAGGSGKPIVLMDNQIAENVDIRLPRGGVIAGRILDEFGEPVANASVTAMRQQFSQGQRRLVATGPRAQTNDIGEYRIFGLTPGQYAVSANTQSQMVGLPIGPDSSGDRTGFAPTYYPATPDVASAQKVAVGIAQTVTGIDIALVLTPLATISGVAIDAQGRPMSNGNVQLSMRGQGGIGFSTFGSSIKQDGTFTVPKVPPGDYVVRANAFRLPPAPGKQPGPPEFAVAAVSVNGDDVTGVRLMPMPQVQVTGRIVFDDPAAAQTVKASAMRVMSQVLNPDDALAGFGGGVPDSTVHDDFTFELKTFPRRIGLLAFAPALPGAPTAAAGWQVKSVRANGLDLTDSGIDLGSQGLSGVEIELTNRPQQVSGTVTDSKGAAAADYIVVAFAQDRARWLSPMNRYTAVARPAPDGTFKVTTLPPGEYYAVALDAIDLNDWQDPDSLEGLSRVATPFALTAGDTRTIELRLAGNP